MEWEFGCKVEDSSGEWLLIQESDRKERMWCAFNGTGIHYIDLDECKILGRPIRLGDVLLAIRKKRDKDFNLHISREYVHFEGLPGEIISKKIWNLKDDNLDNQSEETKQFLIKLLTSQTNE